MHYLTLGEGNGSPLQYSCLENPMDGGAWWATVHGVAKSRRWLSDFTSTFHFHALEEEMATYSSVLAWRIPGMAENPYEESIITIIPCCRKGNWSRELCLRSHRQMGLDSKLGIFTFVINRTHLWLYLLLLLRCTEVVDVLVILESGPKLFLQSEFSHLPWSQRLRENPNTFTR